ncbi:hypothetical protein C8F01DRAFT_1121126 [Mycena amicta]|nr:hypothetical protein C8F01DRAFT_1121126 [Mycena amicta]
MTRRRSQKSETFSLLLNALNSPTTETTSNVLQTLLAFTEALEVSPVDRLEHMTVIDALNRYLSPASLSQTPLVWVEASPEDIIQTNLSGAALTAVLTVIRRVGGPQEIQKDLASCWPAALQSSLVYGRALLRTLDDADPLKVGSPVHAFVTIVSLYHIYAEIDSLRALVQKTSLALAFIVRLWQYEARDCSIDQDVGSRLRKLFPNGIRIPSAADLVRLYIYHLPQSGFVIEKADGGRQNAITALNHVRKSTTALAFSSGNTAVLESVHVSLQNLMFLHDSTSLRELLVTQRSNIVVTELLVGITCQAFDAKTAQGVLDILASIFKFLNGHLAEDGVLGLVYALERGLLTGLIRSGAWLDRFPASGTAIRECGDLLGVHLQKYLIYPSVLREIWRFMELTDPHKILDASGSASKIWRKFTKSAKERMKFMSATDLSRKKCDRNTCSRPGLLRCGSCLSVVYCSAECQGISWIGQKHKQDCALRVPRSQQALDLAAEDILFAQRIVLGDLPTSGIAETWAQSTALPLYAGLDYTTFPAKITFDPPETVKARLDRLNTHAVIFAMFPKGGLDVYCSAWDLGIKKGGKLGQKEVIEASIKVLRAGTPIFLPLL